MITFFRYFVKAFCDFVLFFVLFIVYFCPSKSQFVLNAINMLVFHFYARYVRSITGMFFKNKRKGDRMNEQTFEIMAENLQKKHTTRYSLYIQCFCSQG